jgi:cell division protein FtsW (lipid II flippase)
LIQIIILVVIIGLLVYVKVFGNPVRGTNRWIEWGFIRIQPSEYAKVALILFNSGILARLLEGKVKPTVQWGNIAKKRDIKLRISHIIKNLSNFSPVLTIYAITGIVSIVCVLLILIEPALGNATITALICFSLFIITFPKQNILIGIVLIFLIITNVITHTITFQFLYSFIGFDLFIGSFDLGIIILSFFLILGIMVTLRVPVVHTLIAVILSIAVISGVSYLWETRFSTNPRIVNFLNPEANPTEGGWQLLQSKIAIGSGRIFGKGFLHGTQSKLRYLPEAYNDFIFAALCEEFGFIGAFFLFAFYVFLLLRIISTAKQASSAYEALICFGVASMLIVHIFINTGMNIGILPITGIPLPLISYGGSSVVVTMIALGLVQAVNMNKDVVDSQEGLMISSKDNT